MNTYRVVAPMLTPASFMETGKRRQVHAYYQNDLVVDDPDEPFEAVDIERLLAEGYLVEVETQPVAS